MAKLNINTTDRILEITMIQLGQNELQNRQTQRINEVSRNLSWASVVVGVLALIAILFFSILGYHHYGSINSLPEAFMRP